MNKTFNKKVFFDNIEYLAKNKKMKMGELESNTGVSPGYISRASKENGPTPGIEFIISIARELNINVDTLLFAQLSELTSTEFFIISFLEKLLRETNEGILDWNCQKAEKLNRLEVGDYGFIDHPLFKCETFYEEEGPDYQNELTEPRFVSNTFDVHTIIKDDCYFLEMNSITFLYIMDISKSFYMRKDENVFAREVWLYQEDVEPSFLCSNKNSSPISTLVDALYEAVSENSKHPKIKPEWLDVINEYMNDEKIPF